MTVQILNAPNGDQMVVLAKADYDALLAFRDDAEDLAAVRAFDDALAHGREELVPAAVADRLLAGENPIRVWRTYRGLSQQQLAASSGLSSSYLSQLESGERQGTIDKLRPLADVLDLLIDDIV